MTEQPKINDIEKVLPTPEKNPEVVEVKQEKDPLTPEQQQEEIRLVFENILRGKEYKTLKEKFDDQGLAVWEIVIETDEGTTELSYIRKEAPPAGQLSDTKINATFFDADGMPTGGDTLAIIENGNWKLLEQAEPKKIAEQKIEAAYAEKEPLKEELPQETELIEEQKIECLPHIKELEEMFIPLLDQELLNTLRLIETEQQAKESTQREETKAALVATLKKLQFLKKETNITEESYAELHAKHKIISRAVGMISGKKGQGIVDHER